jgi:catechol 2,3-dioxygenase-like lactoylglutathione lyase family enzyme
MNSIALHPLRHAMIVFVLFMFASAAFADARQIHTIVVPVTDIERSAAFYVNALGFERVGDRGPDERACREPPGDVSSGIRTVALRLGSETIELDQYDAGTSRSIPADSRSNDLWFQHFAIVVSDMDGAYERLQRFSFAPISTKPQTIPASNVAAAGIRAFKFKDPDGHPLELLYFPPGKGAPRWQVAHGRLFLGIDHSAISVADTNASTAFYRDALGFKITGSGTNTGPTQAALDAIPNPVVQITGLRPISASGPGLEFLQYIEPGPGRPAPQGRRQDLSRVRLVVEVDDVAKSLGQLSSRKAQDAARAMPCGRAGFREAASVTDPDGHSLLLVDR